EGRDATHYPLTLVVAPRAELRVRWSYRPELFTAERVEQLARRFERGLTAIADDVTQRVGAVDLLEPSERAQILESSTATSHAVTEPTITAWIDAQGARTPAAVAVIAGTAHVSLAALHARANHIARTLLVRD